MGRQGLVRYGKCAESADTFAIYIARMRWRDRCIIDLSIKIYLDTSYLAFFR